MAKNRKKTKTHLGTRQRTKTHGIDFDCRVPVEAHGKSNGQANGSPGPPVCRVPNVRHTANKPGYRVFVMAHGKLPPFAVCFVFAVRFFSRHTANVLFAVCLLFAVCFFSSRQMDWWSCVRNSAHYELLDSGSELAVSTYAMCVRVSLY